MKYFTNIEEITTELENDNPNINLSIEMYRKFLQDLRNDKTCYIEYLVKDLSRILYNI